MTEQNTRERNLKIREFLSQNPIQKGTKNCYKEVCAKFSVNKDVIKGILRDRNSSKSEDKSKYVTHTHEDIPSQSVKTEVQQNYSTNSISINATRDSEIKSIEDFVQENNIDLSKYDIVSAKNSTWNNGKQQLYAVSLKLEPKNNQKVENNLDNYFESIKSLIKDKKQLPKTESKYVLDNYSNKKSLFIYISDTHIGAMTEIDSLYENYYSASVFKSRMNKLFDEVCLLQKTHGKFDNIFVLNLGDCIDGFNAQTTRGGHTLPQNLSNKEQFEVYTNTIIKFFDKLFESNLANNLKFYSVGESNHAGSLEYVLNRTIEIYLNATYPNIETKVFDKFLGHFEYGDNTIILTHGKDSKNMKFGLPLTLDVKVEGFLNDYIYMNNIRTNNITLVKGDLHQSAVQYGKRFKYKNVMSLYGSSAWIHTNFGSGKSGVDMEILSEDGMNSMNYVLRF